MCRKCETQRPHAMFRRPERFVCKECEGQCACLGVWDPLFGKRLKAAELQRTAQPKPLLREQLKAASLTPAALVARLNKLVPQLAALLAGTPNQKAWDKATAGAQHVSCTWRHTYCGIHPLVCSLPAMWQSAS